MYLLQILILYLFIGTYSFINTKYGNDVLTVHAPTWKGGHARYVGDINGDKVCDMVYYDYTKRTSTILFGSNKWNRQQIDFSNISHFGHRLGFQLQTHVEIFQTFSRIGDINRDGYDDLLFKVVPNSGELSQVYVLYGRLTFKDIDATQWSPDLGVVFQSSISKEALGFVLANIGDYNGDKYPDFLMEGNTNMFENLVRRYYIIFGRQDFNPIISLSPESINHYGFLINLNTTSSNGARIFPLGDLNRDGYSDFIVAEPTKRVSWIILGHKAPFSHIHLSIYAAIPNVRKISLVSNKFGAHGYYTASSSCDFNGDGYLDIFISCDLNVYIILGRKNWDHDIIIDDELGKTVFVISSFLFREISCVGDVNRDGFNDLFLVGTESYFVYGRRLMTNINVRNLGKGGFYLNSAFSMSNPSIDVDDFDDDGLPDILITEGFYSPMYNSYYLPGNTLQVNDPNHQIMVSHEIDVKFGTCYSGAAHVYEIRDFNGDGIGDLLVVNELVPLLTSPIAFLVLGSLDVDLIEQSKELTKNNSIEVISRIWKSFNIRPLAIGDMNNDGYDDTVITYLPVSFSKDIGERDNGPGMIALIYGREIESSGVSIRLGIDDISPNIVFFQGFLPGSRILRVINCDFNGDHRPDLIFYLKPNVAQAEIIIIYGQKTFPSEVNYLEIKDDPSLSKTISNSEVGDFNYAGDFNGDGYEDILLQMSNRRLGILFGSHTGSFEEDIIQEIYAATDPMFSSFIFTAAFDLDFDGCSDIVLGVTETGSFRKMIFIFGAKESDKDRSSIYQSIVTTPCRKNIGYYATLSDVNRDHYGDILLACDRKALILFGDEHIRELNSTESAKLFILHDVVGAMSAVGDVDNDTLVDIAIGPYLIPGRILSDWYPSSLDLLPQDPTGNHDDEESRKQKLFRTYVKYVIEELIFMILVLIVATLLFLLLSRSGGKNEKRTVFIKNPKENLPRSQVSSLQLSSIHKNPLYNEEESFPLI